MALSSGKQSGPKPCCRKYGKVSAAEFARHVKEDKCSKCLAVARYLERESERAVMAKEFVEELELKQANEGNLIVPKDRTTFGLMRQ
jgi:hypothetical protein